MSDKKRTSITVDKDVYRYLQQSDINQSGLINELVKEYKDSEDRQIAALELHYEQKIEDAKELEKRAEEKFSQAEEIKELLDEARTKQNDTLQQAVDALENVGRLTEDKQAVQYWAEETGMEPGELIEYVHSNT